MKLTKYIQKILAKLQEAIALRAEEMPPPPPWCKYGIFVRPTNEPNPQPPKNQPFVVLIFEDKTWREEWQREYGKRPLRTINKGKSQYNVSQFGFGEWSDENEYYLIKTTDRGGNPVHKAYKQLEERNMIWMPVPYQSYSYSVLQTEADRKQNGKLIGNV